MNGFYTKCNIGLKWINLVCKYRELSNQVPLEVLVSNLFRSIITLLKNEVKLIKIPSTKLKNLVKYQVLGLSGFESNKYHPGCEGESGQIFPNSFRKIMTTGIYVHAWGVFGAFPVDTKTKSYEKFLNHIMRKWTNLNIEII